MTRSGLLAIGFILLLPATAPAEVQRRVVNGGQLILEDIPEIPQGLPEALDRFQSIRATTLLEWTENGQGLYIRTRHKGVNQLHRMRRIDLELERMTFFDEPVGEVARQPNGPLLAFTMDRGGSEFDQIYLMDPASREIRLLTDGASLNNRMVWDKSGRRLAYRSTRRNGRSNDIWIMDIDHPEGARLLFEAPDGALWKPISFSRDGKLLIIQQYRGITDSRIHLLNMETGQVRELVGHPEYETSNIAIDFDHNDEGVFFVSNIRGRSAEIGRVPLDPEKETQFVPGSITWDVTEFELSPDGRRGAFVVNEDGMSRLYLFDARRFRFRPVDKTPLGVISDLRFNPSGRALAMSITTPTSPGDVYTLSLGRFATRSGKLQRWAAGDVGGMDTRDWATPRLFRFPAPGVTEESWFNLPGFMYLPKGKGPFPVIIYIHGGPEGQFRPSFNSVVQMWVTQLGAAVVAPNVRGSLGYGRAYLSLDDGRRREDAVRDIGALLDWIGTVEELDASRVAVFGASYGGYMALACAVHYSDRLVAAVDRAGISNFVTYLENTEGYRRDLRRYEYGDERDPEMRVFLESISPLNNVDRIHIPMLIVQGQNDPVVPVTESEQMVQALRERGQTVWYMNALNEGHGYEKKENRDIYQQVTYMFWQRFLIDQADETGTRGAGSP